jgi:cytochrome P450
MGTTVDGRLPPGPRGHLLLGSIPEIRRDNVHAFLDIWRRFGDTVRLRGPMTLYLVAHPDGVKHVLQDNAANYPRPPAVRDRLQAIVGDGLVGAEGAAWVRSRRMAQPAFRRHHLDRFCALFAEATAEVLDTWERAAELGRPLDAEAEMVRVSLANLGASLFQADWRRDLERIAPAVTDILSFANSRLTSVVDTSRLPLPSTRRFHRRLELLDSILYPLIAERRRSQKERAQYQDHGIPEGDRVGRDGTARAPFGGDDLVSMLVDARDEDGARLTDKQVRDETISFFIAGHATIAAALTWTWYLLSTHPESWRRLRAEVDEVLGGRPPAAADLPRLRYAGMVVQEAMRLYPPVYLLLRRALADDEVGGYRIPAGADIAMCPYVTHRHPGFWDNPEGFDPERFAPELAGRRHRMAFFPFSGGPRRCIGEGFAQLQLPLVVAMVSQRYRLSLLPARPAEVGVAVTLRPRTPMLMRVERVP